MKRNNLKIGNSGKEKSEKWQFWKNVKKDISAKEQSESYDSGKHLEKENPEKDKSGKTRSRKEQSEKGQRWIGHIRKMTVLKRKNLKKKVSGKEPSDNDDSAILVYTRLYSVANEQI